MQNVLLRIQGISKSYTTPTGTLTALKNVSLDIYEGEILTLLGVNGAGKTTLSSIIATLHPPTHGRIEYKGASIYENLIQFRKSLAFCPQKPNFEKNLSVKENLIFAGRYYGMDKGTIEKQVSLLLDEFNLTQYADSMPDILSGGYKQRLLIARALMHEPALIILDEPTVAIDAPIRRQLWELIKQLKQKNVAVLLTTHYFDEAEALSDRVCVLDKGEIVLIEAASTLKSKHGSKKLEDIFLELLEQEKKEKELV